MEGQRGRSGSGIYSSLAGALATDVRTATVVAASALGDKLKAAARERMRRM